MPVTRASTLRARGAAAAATQDEAGQDGTAGPLDVAAVRRALCSARPPCRPLVDPWLLPCGASVDACQLTAAERATGHPNRPLREAAAGLRDGPPQRAQLEALVTCPITRDRLRVPARLWALPPAPPLWDDRPYELAELTAWVQGAGRSPHGEPFVGDVTVVVDRALAALADALGPRPGGEVEAPRPWVWRASTPRSRWRPARPRLLLGACLTGVACGVYVWRGLARTADALPERLPCPELEPLVLGLQLTHGAPGLAHTVFVEAVFCHQANQAVAALRQATAGSARMALNAALMGVSAGLYANGIGTMVLAHLRPRQPPPPRGTLVWL